MAFLFSLQLTRKFLVGRHLVALAIAQPRSLHFCEAFLFSLEFASVRGVTSFGCARRGRGEHERKRIVRRGCFCGLRLLRRGHGDGDSKKRRNEVWHDFIENVVLLFK